MAFHSAQHRPTAWSALALGLGVVGASVLVDAAMFLRKPPSPSTLPPPPPAWADCEVQNPMTHVVAIKPGWIREGFLRLALHLVNLRARRYMTGLNVIRSIHFARWVIVRTRRGKQLLFLSNYDGSWMSYIADFIDLLSPFLNAAWRNTEGYPRTWLLLKGGAEDNERFTQWIRRCEVRTHVWYCAHKDLSVNNLHNDLLLYDLLSRERLEPQDEARLLVLLRTGLCLTRERIMSLRTAWNVVMRRRPHRFP
jgi:hypothetical protein